MKPGQIILVKFPFSDLQTEKKRPALVLHEVNVTDKIGVVTLAMITSKLDGLKFMGDYKIRDWKSSGLLHPSLLRLSKVATIEKNLIDRPLGSLSENDLKAIKSGFRKLYKYWI